MSGQSLAADNGENRTVTTTTTVTSTSVSSSAASTTSATASADAYAGESEKFSYMPTFHGAFRGRFEQSTQTGEGRFQVRNARLSIEGKVAPIIDYKFQTDLCDRGKMKILDAWASIEACRGLNFRVGQFRQPFGTDCFRGPANYIFANRSAMARYVASVRGVGLQAGYGLKSVPLKIQVSMFNPTGISEHNVWVKKYAYAAKVSYKPGSLNFAAGFMSLRPEDVRINLWGASAGWTNGTVLLEGEYMHKHYTNNAAKAVNAVNLFADWGLPVKAGVFRRWSLQGRFDSMSSHSEGYRGIDGRLTTDQNSRSRVTVGSTLSYSYRKLRADVRLNYEQYFYGHGGRGDEAGNRVVAELVVSF